MSGDNNASSGFVWRMLLIVFLLVLIPVPARAFGVKPVILKVEMRRGARDVTEFLLFATRDKPERVRLYLTNYEHQRNGQLDLSDIDPEQIKAENQPTIEISQRELTLNPEQETTIRVTLSVPSGAPRNEYVYALIVEAVDDDVIRRPGSPTVGLRQRVAVPVIINVPGRPDRFSARFLDVGGALREDGYYLIASMENTGNRYVDASGIARIRDDSGRILHTMPLIAVSIGSVQKLGVISILPGGIRDFVAPVKYPLTAGTYQVEVIGTIRQNARQRITARAEITLEKDLAEELTAVQPIELEPKRFDLKLKPGGTTTQRIEVVNVYIDDLILEISSDSELIQTSRIPVRLPVGASQSIPVKITAPENADLQQNVIITIKERDLVLKIPVFVILQKEN